MISGVLVIRMINNIDSGSYQLALYMNGKENKLQIIDYFIVKEICQNLLFYIQCILNSNIKQNKHSINYCTINQIQ